MSTAEACLRPGAIGLIVTGAAGRMGKRIIALAAEEPGRFKVAGALDRAECLVLGQDAGKVAGAGELGVVLTTTIPAGLGSNSETAASGPVVIDFSAAAATRGLIGECQRRHIAMVIGTTGLTADDHKLIDQAAKTIPILQATNTSMGVNVLQKLVADAARQLGDDYDIEIVEAHHNLKKDAPSGTALSLAESICRATGRKLEKDLVHGREGKEALRAKGTIGMHAVRMGDVVGEHTVYFAAMCERLEIKHVASSRDTLARGALRAAAWIAGQKPGRYTMANVLGL
ncbi:MAG: 4-hydroxy-tetrahydrodipicolinate reductase [Phycisphaerae bacterium]